MTQYKLLYFNGRGRAEYLRLIFAAANQKYEDARIEMSECPKYKASTPFEQIPILEIRDGANLTVLSQSNAIGEYLFKKFEKKCLRSSYLKTIDPIALICIPRIIQTFSIYPLGLCPLNTLARGFWTPGLTSFYTGFGSILWLF